MEKGTGIRSSISGCVKGKTPAAGRPDETGTLGPGRDRLFEVKTGKLVAELDSLVLRHSLIVG